MRTIATLALGLGLVAPALAAPPPPTPADIATFKEGSDYVFRTDQTNYPIYTFDRDAPEKSNCSGACAEAWPPILVEDGRPVGHWTAFRREDGRMQWAWRGKPVYRYARDEPEKPTGDGLGGVWRLLPEAPAD